MNENTTKNEMTIYEERSKEVKENFDTLIQIIEKLENHLEVSVLQQKETNCEAKDEELSLDEPKVIIFLRTLNRNIVRQQYKVEDILKRLCV